MTRKYFINNNIYSIIIIIINISNTKEFLIIIVKFNAKHK